MTPSDMETMIKNLDLRTTRIEQILPTLATKDDLKAYATKDDLAAGLTEAKRFTQVLFEDLKGDIKLLAGHLADVSQDVAKLSQGLTHVSQDLAHVSQVVDTLARRKSP